jgi:uncharacterized protein YegP (UPF0339 family)
MGKFVISKRKNGEFQFNLLAGNGQVILASEGYTSKPSCMNGVKSVMENAANIDRFDSKVAKSGQFYFNLKASNGQVIGKSEMYESKASCENGIASVKKNAPGATIDDNTKD